MYKRQLHSFLVLQHGSAAREILGMDEASDVSLPGMIEVRTCGVQGRGYFAKSGVSIEAGTTVLESSRPIVWAVSDDYESRNCRSVSQLAGYCGQLVLGFGVPAEVFVRWSSAHSFCGAISTT